MIETVWLWTHPFVFGASIALLVNQIMKLTVQLHEAEERRRNQQQEKTDATTEETKQA